ncbi:restriction endonuclease [Clostridium perfringens]|uniref:restriction endonuclease n=1 Tax=Clostridium perfringens TaxID=1502 RepID=UPI0018E4A9CC|nr:restriction endonuclease [Clostridium perfringens]MBI6020130.1 restriction endonuclease [Clostridium perfringens]
MNKEKLTIKDLIIEASHFCKRESMVNHTQLIGVTDGKAVGTYIEHKFQEYLAERYELEIGSSAKGIDLPSEDINTDIKVTSIKQPQSSCPFRDAKQKIFGLGYNLLVFVYNKKDSPNTCELIFEKCTFICKERTADYTTTKMLKDIVENGGMEEDIIAYFYNINLPGDEITYQLIAENVMHKVPKIGYLTISNALQWRLQYKRVINLENSVKGIINFEREDLC